MVDQTPEAGDPKKPAADEPAPDAPVPSQPAPPPPPAVDWAAPAAPPAAVAGWAATTDPAPGTSGGAPSSAWGQTPTPTDTPGAPPPPVGWTTLAPPPPTEVAPGLTFGSTGRRFVAFVLDQIVLLLIASVISLIAVPILGTDNLSSVLVQVLTAAISLVYFVGTWRSSARATPGMRLLKLQIGNAFDGRTLTTEQSVRRWVALGEPLGLLFATTATAGIGGLALLIWSIVLLVTTATSPTKQGLHDRFANSAIVEPAGIGNGAVIGCVVILVVVFIVLPVILVLGVLSAGSSIITILSAVGSPAP
jgi:uncharacterized RDD family membrane protein YckC